MRAEGKSLEKALKNDLAEEIDKALEKNKDIKELKLELIVCHDSLYENNSNQAHNL